MNELKISIEHMRFPPSRPDIEWGWMRRILGLENLSESTNLIQDFSLEIGEGKIAAIVGASGAGKTTLLRIIAGLEKRFKGSVSLDGDAIVNPDSRICLIPQAHTLMPWHTVEKNMLFNGADTELVSHLLDAFGMSEKRQFYPAKLSGGERARVTLMCAMCARPRVMLLDEPFRGLDQLTKQQCMADLSKWLDQTDYNEIVIIVSHDIASAVFFCDEVIVTGSRPLHLHERFTCSTSKDRKSPELIDLEERALHSLRAAAATNSMLVP